jgi:predicted ATP-dependent endonuclease of OLD family
MCQPTIEEALDQAASVPLALIRTVESWLDKEVKGLVLMIEESELVLRPRAQRALYRLRREFASLKNQVIRSTHAATFLNDDQGV